MVTVQHYSIQQVEYGWYYVSCKHLGNLMHGWKIIECKTKLVAQKRKKCTKQLHVRPKLSTAV